MAEPLANSRYLLRRAKEHIDRFKELEDAWAKAPDLYKPIVEPTANRVLDVIKIKLTKPLPESLPGLAFDAANNLRSALDQAAFAVAVAAGTAGRKAHFPFGDTLAEVESRATEQSKHIPKEVFDVMVRLQPYKGGNVLLWGLNKLANTNKHEIIVPTVVEQGQSTMLIVEATAIGWPGPRWDKEKNEMVVMTIPHGSKFDYHLNWETFVVIGDVPGLGGRTVVPVLNKVLKAVEESLAAIEAEARRIGVFN